MNIRGLLVGAAVAMAARAHAEVPSAVPLIAIHRSSGAIVVDGSLADPGWRDAARIDHFYETSPGNNVEPKVKTVAFLTYDDKYFYIGVRCEDPEPRKIRAPFVERDSVIGTDDNIAIFLDTRNDKRTAIELRVNPRGIQGDAIYNDANGNEDFSPDYFYDTAAEIDAGGWSAEFRIPFSSLRYAHADPQTWNILVWRNYPREFRYFLQSAPIPRDSNCYICHMHPIIGLAGLPAAGHAVVAPYVTAAQDAFPEAGPGSRLATESVRSREGVDVKWTPAATNAVDLTVNPDFSQVESDVPQITVNQRFAVFYPEKRPFFLEGFDLFDTPLQVAYTRTITSPRWGVRTTGRVGNSAYTLLVTDDRGGGLTILPGPLGSGFAPQDFKSLSTIARVRHDIGSSYVGAVVTDREISGGGHNRVIGPDFQWRPNQGNAVTGELLYSQTVDPNRPDLSPAFTGERKSSFAATINWNHQSRKLDSFVEAKEVGDKFRADLGFIPQAGYREVDGQLALRFYPQKGLLNFVRPYFAVDRQTDQHGNTILQDVVPGVFLMGRRNLQAFGNFHPDQRIRVGDRVLTQRYANWLVQFDPNRRVSRIVVQGHTGQAIDFANARTGRGTAVEVDATLRPHDRITFDLTTSREWLNRGGGRVYTAQVQRAKTTYSFSNRSIVRLIGQYVTTERSPELYSFDVPRHSGDFLGSVLYSFKLNWQTVLFVGYGDDRLITPDNDLVRADRSLFFKVSYALQM